MDSGAGAESVAVAVADTNSHLTNGQPTPTETDQNSSQDPADEYFPCTVCGKRSEKKCGACNQVYYCSASHQKQDWKIHKSLCGPFRIDQNTEDLSLGKQWVANRDLEAGHILLDEPVTFYGPFSADGNSHPARCPPGLVCIVCGLCSYSKKKYYCTKCGWPVCGVDCENDKVHTENECDLFSKSYGSRSYEKVLDEGPASALLISRAIATLRGSQLSITNPKAFQEVLKLQYLIGEESSADFDYVHANHPQYIRMYLSKLVHPRYILPLEISNRLQQVILINSFIVCTQSRSSSGYGADPHVVAFTECCGEDVISNMAPAGIVDNQPQIGNRTKIKLKTELRYKHLLYIKASRLNHSCSPNCSWSIGPAPDFKIRIRTSVPIKKNEPLTITYPISPYNVSQEMETVGRRDHLYMFRGFQCRCVRCTDPTELGTFISAIRCTNHECQSTSKCEENGQDNRNGNGNDGYCVPSDPLTTPGSPGSYEYPFKCLKCGKIHSPTMLNTEPEGEAGKDTNNDMTVQQKHFNNMMSTLNTRSWNELSDLIKNLNSFRDKYAGKIFHPKWSFMLDATLNFIRVLKDEIYENPTISVLERHLQWIQTGLDYFDRALPGVNLKRARLLRHRAAVLRVLLLEHSYKMSETQVRDNYKLFLEASADALKFYEKDFPHPGKSISFHAQVIHLRLMQVKYELGTRV